MALAITGVNLTPQRLQAARDVAEAELELRRLEQFRLGLIEAEAAKIVVGKSAMGDQQKGGDEPPTDDTARAYMQALRALATLERYERRAWSRHWRAIHVYARAAEE